LGLFLLSRWRFLGLFHDVGDDKAEFAYFDVRVAVAVRIACQK
jgi:hypothetical protein